jgi:hypothetical protein
MSTKNANSATGNGLFITDKIASRIKKGFVIGPYEEPHSNSSERINFYIIDIVQNSKIRAVLHMSSPKGRSLNDAIDKLTVDKLNMSSPKLFVEFKKIRKRHTFLKKRYSRRLQIDS